ncbi:MlaD family protein [Streptomyces sp. NPDC051940]|uniref:MlaD family protein n=1 Tax=Streptomyces sp. NPDC051940 TaxID=3155675 RepID=UPI003428C453
MITRATVLKNIAFLVIAVLVLGFIGVRYAGLGGAVGLGDDYTVRVRLAQTGGLFPHSEVTYRGVSVGRVDSIDLTGDGVVAKLAIRDSAPPIPRDLQAVVANYSAVGEQYIDLRPNSDAGPYLDDGAEIQQASTTTPAPVTNLLTSIDSFATSVDTKALRIAVEELGNAFAGHGEDLQRLLDTGSEFITAADEALPESIRLMVDGKTVLKTQSEEGESLKAFAAGLREFAGQLKANDTDLRKVIDETPKAALQASALLRDLDPSLSVLLANLLTTSDVAVTRQAGIEQLLVRLPQITAAGSTAVTPRGARFGMALTFFDPLPCTAGYGGTKYRTGLDTTTPPPLNTKARCTLPPSSGGNVRGSGNAPGSGKVPEPAKAGGLLYGDSADSADDTGAALPGALGLPGLEQDGPQDMSGLLGLS